MISANSSFSSSAQATSLNNTLSESLSYNLALDLPKVIALFDTQPIFDIKTSQITMNNTNVIIVGSISAQNSSLVLSFIIIAVSISGLLSHNSFNESFLGRVIISLGIFVIFHSITDFQLSVAIALCQSISTSEYNHSEKFFSNWFNAISVSTKVLLSFIYGDSIMIINITTKIVSSVFDLLFFTNLIFFKFGFLGIFLFVIYLL